MEKFTKILAFINAIVYVLGIGCVGYLFYYNEPFFAVINIMLLAQAYPFVEEQWNYLKS